jgi:hypothetical protein
MLFTDGFDSINISCSGNAALYEIAERFHSSAPWVTTLARFLASLHEILPTASFHTTRLRRLLKTAPLLQLQSDESRNHSQLLKN